jgi:hypothetical protein
MRDEGFVDGFVYEITSGATPTMTLLLEIHSNKALLLKFITIKNSIAQCARKRILTKF